MSNENTASNTTTAELPASEKKSFNLLNVAFWTAIGVAAVAGAYLLFKSGSASAVVETVTETVADTAGTVADAA